MVKGSLVVALDFKKSKDQSIKPEKYSYRRGEQWFVVSFGNGFSNTWRADEFDEAGLRWLEANERKDESRGDDGEVSGEGG